MTVAVSAVSDEPEADASAGTMIDAGEAGLNDDAAFEDEGDGNASSASSCSFTIASPPEGV